MIILDGTMYCWSVMGYRKHLKVGIRGRRISKGHDSKSLLKLGSCDCPKT